MFKKYTNKYSQREWDRTVGWGKVPPEYSITSIDVNFEMKESEDDIQTPENSSVTNTKTKN
jgi:hypothetical protein